MSHIFRIGDRVRIKYSDQWPQLAGQEGVVEGVDTWSYHPPTSSIVDGALIVAPIAWGSSWHPTQHLRFCPQACQVEPLNPPKSQISEIIAMTGLPDFQVAAGECANV